MRFFLVLTLGVNLAGAATAAERRPIVPAGVKAAGPYSPAILSGDFLYVAGQGAADAQGQLAPGQEGQIRQCLRNVKAVVEAAGLTLDYVVYVQVYLMEYADERTLNRVWKEFFPNAPPARSTI